VSFVETYISRQKNNLNITFTTSKGITKCIFLRIDDNP